MSDALRRLGRAYVEARERKELIERDFKTAEEAFREAERELWTALEESGVKTTVLELGEPHGDVQIQRRETITSRILDEEAAARALERMGLAEELLGERKIRKGVSNEYVRDWLASGQPLPEGLDFNARRYINMTRK